jgi:hypothetical protein
VVAVGAKAVYPDMVDGQGSNRFSESLMYLRNSIAAWTCIQRTDAEDATLIDPLASSAVCS